MFYFHVQDGFYLVPSCHGYLGPKLWTNWASSEKRVAVSYECASWRVTSSPGLPRTEGSQAVDPAVTSPGQTGTLVTLYLPPFYGGRYTVVSLETLTTQG